MEDKIFKVIDCIGDNCPMPLIKTREAIMKSEKGDVNFNSTYQFADVIREHIKERLELLGDVKEVKVIFNDET